MIRRETLDGIAIVRIDRPEKRNALTVEMLAALMGAILACGSDGSRAFVLSGAGPQFCTGFDLTVCRGDSGVLGVLLTSLSRAVEAMRGLRVGVVVSAHGAAIAGGCALLGSADVVVTTPGAKIGYPVVRLGISPAVSAPFLRQSVGDGAGRARQLDPGLIDGREAVRLGLASECVGTGDAESDAELCERRAVELAGQFAAKPPGAFAETKRWLDRIAPVSRIAEALAASVSLVGSAEERERLELLWKK